MDYSRVLLQRLSLSGYAAQGTLLPTEEPLKSPGLLVSPSQHDSSRRSFPMQKRIRIVVVTLLALLSLSILYHVPYRVALPLWSNRRTDLGAGNRTLGVRCKVIAALHLLITTSFKPSLQYLHAKYRNATPGARRDCLLLPTAPGSTLMFLHRSSIHPPESKMF